MYRHVPLLDIQHVIVADDAQAKRTFLGLHQLGLGDDLFRFRICPELFDPRSLSELLRSGGRPAEVDWDLTEMTGD